MNSFNDEVCDYISTPAIENFGWYTTCPKGSIRKPTSECPSGCARHYLWNAPDQTECLGNYE